VRSDVDGAMGKIIAGIAQRAISPERVVAAIEHALSHVAQNRAT